MIPAGNKAKRLSSVNHTTKTIHHHHHHHHHHQVGLKLKLQIMQLKASIAILGSAKYFLTSSALQTLVLPNPFLFLRLS